MKNPNGGDRRQGGRFDGPGRRTYGERRDYSERRESGGRRNDSEKRDYSDRRDYSDKRGYSDRRDYSDKHSFSERRDYSDRRASHENRGPRVGRVAQDVPAARRVTGGEWQAREAAGRSWQEESWQGKPYRGRPHPDKPYQGGSFNRGGDLHRGGAWRSESGPKGRDTRRDAAPDYEPPEIPEELADAFTDVPEDDRLLVGRNPIREALKAGRPVEKLLVASGDLSGSAREIVGLAKASGVVVQTVERSRLDQIHPAHQGMLAYVAAVPYASVEDILAVARERGEDPFVIILDGITDPHNLGAIVRSAECAGAHGVIVPERRAAGLTPAAAKAAAGAMSYMKIARVKNLNRAIEELKAENIWIAGTAMDGEDAFSADLTGPIALVIGSEGDGVSRLTLEKCDRTVSLPMKGRIESLNASVAAGILMYEIVRQRAK